MLLVSGAELSGSVDFDHRDFLSFEKSVAPARALDKASVLSVSPLHFKNGSNSLRWDWKKSGARIMLDTKVPYMLENPNPRETSIPTFVFWVYSPAPSKDSLRVSFMKNGCECCHFTHGLDFAGWRGAWVPFRDMTGRPLEGMDAVVMTVTGPQRKGTLFFDGIITSVFEDARYHTAGFDSRFINRNTDVHWLLLCKHWDKTLAVDDLSPLTANQIGQFETVRERYIELLLKGKKTRPLQALRQDFDRRIGKPVFFTRYAETYLNLGITDAAKRFADEGQLLRPYNDLMLDIASAWYRTEDSAAKSELEWMYLEMVRHILDEGFAAGSAMGTLHHLGYSMRNFYNAPVIMRDVLRKAGLAAKVQQAMEWFSGVGECKLPPQVPGVDIDAFNTCLLGRMASLVMLEDGPYKRAYFKALKRWVDNGFVYVSGLKPCMKADGTVQHHRKAYPAYAVGGLEGAVRAAWMLAGSDYALSEESYNNLKRALLELRFFCNGRYFPLAMSGRHPDGKGALEPSQFARLSCAKDGFDADLASAYLRLCPDKGAWRKEFSEAGFKAEATPAGVRSYPFNCSLSMRCGEHLVTIAGHSRYMWAAETYQGANHYGRYLTYGSMQIDADGFRNAGWDWCHIPGTTAAVLPMEKMKADVLNVDEWSGYEEMLLSDQWFAGSVMHDVDTQNHTGRYGAYAMILHDHDKYDGTLWAHKSFFCFDGKVVCLGSGITEGDHSLPLHTTLFQNCLECNEPASLTEFKGGAALGDRFGNFYLVKDADVVLRRGLQHSLDEETDAPNSGCFELAYIDHTGKVPGAYEYMVIPNPCPGAKVNYSREASYKVISRSNALHAVKDLASGVVAAAVFEEAAVDELVNQASPCMLMYSRPDDASLLLSVANPDLALYGGPADEVYVDGKRQERSVYGRKWIDNDCAATTVRVKLNGKWTVSAVEDGTMLPCIRLVHAGNLTEVEFSTGEGRTEEIRLIKMP